MAGAGVAISSTAAAIMAICNRISTLVGARGVLRNASTGRTTRTKVATVVAVAGTKIKVAQALESARKTVAADTARATAAMAGAWVCDFSNLTGTSAAGTVTACVICTP